MTIEELRNLIEKGEGESLEFKETTGQRTEACRTLCAFLNGRGGSVVFGVSNKGKLIGQLVSDETKKDLARTFYDFEPGVDIAVEYVNVDDTHQAIVCMVEHGPRCPYVYDGRPYKRIESTTVKMRQEEYNHLLRLQLNEMGEEDFSAKVCPLLSFTDLNPSAIRTFRRLWADKSGESRIQNLSDEQTLRDCGAMRRNGELTYASLILFGTSAALREKLPASECIFEYRAHDSSGPADERKSYRDAFFIIYDDIWKRINLRNAKQHYQDGLFVMDIPQFNERVVREALLNAIAHRNYQMQGYVMVRQYPDALQIENPGGFPYGVTAETLLDCSTPRNRLIAEIFELAGLVERAGQGVNLMFEFSVRESKALPDYSRSDNLNVRLTLNGLLIDSALLRMVQRIEDQTLAQFCTEDFLSLYRLAQGQRLSGNLLKRIPRLIEFGLVEKIERGHYVLSRSYYEQKGEVGKHTRRVGLISEECKALIMKHVRFCGEKGATLSDFVQMLSGTPVRRIRYFLKELRETEVLYVKGAGRGARWFLVKESDKRTEN